MAVVVHHLVHCPSRRPRLHRPYHLQQVAIHYSSIEFKVDSQNTIVTAILVRDMGKSRLGYYILRERGPLDAVTYRHAQIAQTVAAFCGLLFWCIYNTLEEGAYGNVGISDLCRT